jgi:hypothetical protein
MWVVMVYNQLITGGPHPVGHQGWLIIDVPIYRQCGWLVSLASQYPRFVWMVARTCLQTATILQPSVRFPLSSNMPSNSCGFDPNCWAAAWVTKKGCQLLHFWNPILEESWMSHLELFFSASVFLDKEVSQNWQDKYAGHILQIFWLCLFGVQGIP